MKMQFGGRVITTYGDIYKCEHGGNVFYTQDRQKAMEWIREGQPYELRTKAFSTGFSGQVWNIDSKKMVSKMTVYFEDDTAEARNKAWADLHNWARKYGIGG